MLFLIQYDRRAGKLVKLERFEDAQWSKAYKAQLDLEIDLGRCGLGHEVVLLQAASEEAIHKTHSRYFQDVKTLCLAFAAKVNGLAYLS